MLLWPIILITLGLTCYVAYKYVHMERSVIMSNWTDQRCDIFVMFAAYYLRPETDTRSDAEFATDNFKFCMKRLVTRSMEFAMSPLHAIIGVEAIAAEGVTEVLNMFRELINRVMDWFMSYITPFTKRFEALTYQLSVVTQYLKTAFQRANATLLSFVYIGLTIITGIQNMMTFVMNVVVIILDIMIVLIALLFWLLWPLLIFIVPVIQTIQQFGNSQQKGVANDANDAFCFVPDTPVVLADGSTKPISEIRIGDVLELGGTVEGVLTFDGTTTPLYDLNGIRVSGSHLVQGLDSSWHSVAEDSRSVPCQAKAPLLYCLNTSNRIIPIRTNTGSIQLFRDWEEIDADDQEGQDAWDRLVAKMLGRLIPSAADATFSLMDPSIKVQTPTGPVPLASIRMGQELELSYNQSTKVIGIVEGRIYGQEHPGWMSACIEKTYIPTEGVCHRQVTTLPPSKQPIQGRHLITDSGLFIISQNGVMHTMRDFTEVGMHRIHETYPLVASRLARK
jgi:hypothetical protein